MQKGKYILSGGLLIGALLAAAYWRYAPPAYAGADARLNAVEDALALPETIVLGSVDVDYLNALHSRYFGDPSTSDLAAPALEPASSTEALRAVIEEAGSISRASLALYRPADGGLGKIIVLDGKFVPENMVEPLRKYSQATSLPNQPATWAVRFEDVESCKLSESWTVQATNERVVAVAGDDNAMLARLRDEATPGRDMARWREFRRDRFAAAAVFLPDKLPESDVDPMLAMSAHLAQQNLAGFQSVYLGAGMKPLLPSGELSLWFAADTPSVASEKASSWQAAVAASRKEWAAVMPTVAALHDHAAIEARSNFVTTTIGIDRSLARELRQLPGEILGQMFGGFGMQGGGTQADAPDRDQIDANPRVFVAKTTIGDLPAFDASAPFADTPAATAGPFGIALTGIRLTGSETRALELDLRATATKVANVGDDPSSMMAFSITSVQDTQGNELLRTERCGRDRNSAPARPQHSMNERLQSTKSIRLIEDARQTDIASIEGKVQLRLASDVETIELDAPKVGDRLERDGVRVEITRVDPSAISYRASGAVDRLLHVRGKNARGEVLSRGSTLTTGGVAKSVQQEYQGKVATLEFVVARAIEERDFPFEIHSARLSPEEGWAGTPGEPFQAYAKADLMRDLGKPVTPERFGTPLATAAAGPALLDFDRISSFGSLRLDFSLFLPRLRNLAGALTAAQVQLDTLTLADGTLRRPDTNAQTWTSMVSLKASGDAAYRGDAAIDTGLDIKRQQLAAATGRVLLRVPRAFETTTISTAEVGAESDTGCGRVLLTETSELSISIEGAGDPACAYAARALGTDGKEMHINSANIETRPGSWLLNVRTNGTPQAIELIAGTDVERIEFPFAVGGWQR